MEEPKKKRRLRPLIDLKKHPDPASTDGIPKSYVDVAKMISVELDIEVWRVLFVMNLYWSVVNRFMHRGLLFTVRGFGVLYPGVKLQKKLYDKQNIKNSSVLKLPVEERRAIWRERNAIKTAKLTIEERHERWNKGNATKRKKNALLGLRDHILGEDKSLPFYRSFATNPEDIYQNIKQPKNMKELTKERRILDVYESMEKYKKPKKKKKPE